MDQGRKDCEKVILEEKVIGREGINYMETWRRSMPGRGQKVQRP